MSELIPFHWYSHENIFLREKKMFDVMPRYCGHESMVPHINDFYTLESANHSKMLVNNEKGVSLMSNICRHRQAIMRQGKGNQRFIHCPAHCWRYDSDGTLLHAPQFKENPCLNLKHINHVTWKGLLFENADLLTEDFKNPYLNHIMDFSSYAFDSSVTTVCHYNWKIFINTYLDIYHVNMIHPGLRSFIHCEDVIWEFGSNYSIQTVQINSAWKKKAGSPAYEKVQNLLCEHTKGKNPEYGVVWMMFYPNLMIEHYPNAIVVSQVIPTDANHCTNIVEFYYPKDMILSNHPYCQAFQTAYLETAAEDDGICEKMHEGTKISAELDDAESGPIQFPLEGGLSHFHAFMRQCLKE